ncbi:hypothetical protein [Streptococcus uberis]|uniref:hypothetical protein n=1 Tax=Streptococcus uberis TaxID=1349 RepID=UPI001939E5DD|nr:hypothetical protein [Streptococcus uberis]
MTLSNDQRAHDLAILAVQIESNNLRTEKYNEDNIFDIYNIYKEAYEIAKTSIDRDFN